MHPHSHRSPSPGLLATAVLMLVTTAGQAAGGFQLQPFVAIYEARYGLLVGQLTLHLEHVAGDEWVMTSTLAPRGVTRGLARLLGRGELMERTRLRFTVEGVLPLRYERIDGISGPARNASLHFLHDEGRLAGTDRGQRVDLPLDGEVFDRLSVQLQLMRDLTIGLRREEYRVVDRTEIVVMEVAYAAGRPVIRAAGQEFATLALDHRSRSSTRSTRIWTALEHQYLPVRIEQTRADRVEWNGVLSGVSWGAPPAEPAREMPR